MEMAISEVENRVKSMEGLKWERNDVNTITIYDVPFEIRRRGQGAILAPNIKVIS